jgi:hypothetical protein
LGKLCRHFYSRQANTKIAFIKETSYLVNHSISPFSPRSKMLNFSIKNRGFTLSMAIFSTLYYAQEGVCHGFIKAWSADDGKTWTLGQKQPLSTSSIRGFSQNTGWIGSKFLTKPAIVCGSGLTPSLKVVAPSGDLFSHADQSAGKTLAVASGAVVRLLINDEPHKV